MSKRLTMTLLLFLAFVCGQAGAQSEKVDFAWGERALAGYQQQLVEVRQGRPVYPLPNVRFYLFGMGSRRKLIYCGGELVDVKTQEVRRHWEIEKDLIVPSEYVVLLKTDDGTVTIREDEEAVWVIEHGHAEALTRGQVHLPRFDGNRLDAVLRVLHQELLINVVDGKPLPNLFVYSKPWYRDGAMMAMAFRKTGNLALIRDWILGLQDPYDRNNAGETEADNLGEALYLVSLVSDKSHPLVRRILNEVPRFERDGRSYICGHTDFAEHCAYQTKWLKFGLRALGLKDSYRIPTTPDKYSDMFWWGFLDEGPPLSNPFDAPEYPYLDWARDHRAGSSQGPLTDALYPLTWETKASQANYRGMERLSNLYSDAHVSVPHSWHSAEMFLYLLRDK